MKDYYSLFNFFPGFKKGKYNRQPKVFILLFLNFILSIFYVQRSNSQGIIPTKGKDFWIGFPYNPQWSNSLGTKRCDVFVTSDVSTTGVISIPLQGWTQSFTVNAYQTTTITIPVNLVEHITSEVIETKGVEVVTQDTVSVFAISFQKYTADATVIYPKQSLGTEYRICSYPGLQGSSPGNLNSELLVVSTEDGTQISITPIVPTLGGHPAGIPFIVNLDAGQSYQVQSSTYTNDLTGTVIKATDSSGSCRPFAVFSGTACVNIPSGCYACDVLYDQALPVANWGTTYYAVPFSFATSYTLRILANQNNTSYTVNGIPGPILNAGQFTETNNITGSSCIIANKPVSAIQFMEGSTCAGAGDPSMMYLNAQEQKIDRVTFSTVTSTVITQHNVNVIMNTAQVSQLTLDGVPVPAGSFSTFASCNSISYAQLSLTQGSHTLAADSGFTAYVYGTGGFESYAYSVGSFSKSQPIIVDSILCSNDTIDLGTINTLFGVWWSTNTDPNDTISTSPVLVLTPPIIPDIYIEHGNEYISGCEKVLYFSVEVPDPPSPWISANSTTACQNQQVQLNAGAIPVSSIYQYSWTPVTGLNNPNITNPVLTAVSSAWYSVAISSPNGCAPTVYDSVYINVLQIPLPNAGVGGNQTICLGEPVTLSVTGNFSCLWMPMGDTTSTITVYPAVTTNYIVFVTDTNGCENSDTVAITVNPLPNANAGADQTICYGANATLTATGGVSYLWNPGGGTNNFIVVSPPASVNYIVQVTGANGCTKNDTVLISVNPLPVANAGPDQDICFGDSASLIASGGASYLWTPGGSTVNSIWVSPSLFTNYIVQVTDSNGCKNKDTVSVNVNANPVAYAGSGQTICSGDSIMLTASGGSFYLWNPGGFSTAAINVSPGVSVNYVVIVSDSNGCNSSDTVHINVNPLPVADAGSNQSICMGDSAMLIASPAGATYLWTPPGSSGISIVVSPIVNTTYQLMVTDVNGCSNTDSVFLSVNPAAVADAGSDQTICSGFHATLNATGGVSYLWMPGGNTSASITVSPAVNTNYIVQVTDSNGCTAFDTVVVFIDPYISGTASSSSICIGESITLSDSGGVSYLWMPGGSTNDSITVSPQSSTDYMVHIITAIGCLVYDTLHVNVNPLPSAFAGPDQVMCIGGNVTLTASGGNSYLWITNGNPNQTITVSPAVSQNYIVQVTDSNGCRKNDTAYVLVNALPVASAGPDQSVCPGDSVTLTATGGTTYLWNPGGVINAAITIAPLVPASYFVLVTDQNGCQNTDTAYIDLFAVPVPGFSLSAPVCPNVPITFTNTSSIAFGTIFNNAWSFGDGSNASTLNAVHSYSNAGNYIVGLTVTSNNGCMNNINHPITVNVNPVADFSVKNNCLFIENQFTDLSNISSGIINQWLWDFGDGTTGVEQNPSHSYLQTGIYDISLVVTSDSGCLAEKYKAQALEIYPLPEAHFIAVPGEVSIFKPLVNFMDESSGGTEWQWDFGDGIGKSGNRNPYYFYQDTGFFTVRLILASNYGCLDTTYGEVYVIPDYTIYFPNAFSPNGDYKNDFFIPDGTGIKEYELYIFNRWGKIVFQSQNMGYYWNGRDVLKNIDCVEDVYLFKSNIIDYKNLKHQYTGSVTLVR